MNIAYVVRIGRCYYQRESVSFECTITRTVKNARFFNKKEEAIKKANKFGGRVFQLQLQRLKEDISTDRYSVVLDVEGE